MVADIAGASSTHLLQELVRGRRSIRQFRDEPVARHIVAQLLRDSLWAPSPHNSQPWRFTVLFQLEDKVRLAGAMSARLRHELETDGLDSAAIERQTARSEGRISAAPVVVVCSLERDGLVHYPDERRNGLEWQMAVQSVGATLQTLFLLAAERGIGSCWMAAPMYCPDVVRATLCLPQSYDPQALALMGYESLAGRVRPRRQFDEVVDFR